MKGVAIENQRCSLGNEHAVVNEVFGRAVRRGVPERRVDTEDFLDDGADVGQVLLIIGIGPAIPADDEIQFVVSARLDVGVLPDERKEPLDDA